MMDLRQRRDEEQIIRRARTLSTGIDCDSCSAEQPPQPEPQPKPEPQLKAPTIPTDQKGEEGLTKH